MQQLQQLLGDKPMNVMVPAILFGLLSPNFLVNLTTFRRPLFPANPMEVFTHVAVFALVYMLLRKQFPQYY